MVRLFHNVSQRLREEPAMTPFKQYSAVISNPYRDGDIYGKRVDLFDFETQELVESFMVATVIGEDYEMSYDRILAELEENGYGHIEENGGLYAYDLKR